MVNIVLGAWLVASSFAWHHTAWQATNAAITGAVTVLVATIAFSAPGFRFVNTIVGAWLVISSFAFARASGATGWNNLLVGAAIVWLSLLGGEDVARNRPIGPGAPL